MHFFSKVISCRNKKHFSNLWVFFKILFAVSQESALRWNKYYTLLNHIPLITKNLLDHFLLTAWSLKWICPSGFTCSSYHALLCLLCAPHLPPFMPLKSSHLSQRSKLNPTTEAKSHPITSKAVAEFPKCQCSRPTCLSSYSSTPPHPRERQSWKNKEMPHRPLISWSYSCCTGRLEKNSSTWHDLMQILSRRRNFWKKISLSREHGIQLSDGKGLQGSTCSAAPVSPAHPALPGGDSQAPQLGKWWRCPCEWHTAEFPSAYHASNPKAVHSNRQVCLQVSSGSNSDFPFAKKAGRVALDFVFLRQASYLLG